jgi:thiol-disulfide isomerase/thioredoxin
LFDSPITLHGLLFTPAKDHTMKFAHISLLLFAIACKPQPKYYDESRIGQPLPAVSLLQADSTFFNVNERLKGRPFTVFYFSTECPHCRQQLTNLLSHMNELKHAPVLMITIASHDQVKAFSDEFSLSKYPNIIMGQDTGIVYKRFMQIINVPMLAAYDKRTELQKVYPGEQQPEKLVSIITSNAKNG